MRGLISILNELRISEFNMLKKSLTSGKKHRLNSQTLKLFRLINIHSASHIDRAFYKNILYKKGNNLLFNRVVRRLFDKSIDSLIITGLEDTVDKMRSEAKHFIVTRKYLLALHILHKRLANREALRFLELESEKMATKHRLIVELAEVSLRRAKTEGFLHGIKEYYRFTNLREKYLTQIRLSDKIQKYYYELILNPLYSNPYNRETTKSFLEAAFSHVTEEMEEMKSLDPNDEYLLLYLRIEYGIIIGDMAMAIRSAGRQLQLYNTIPTMRIPGKLTALYANLGYIHIISEDYIGAAKYVSKALHVSTTNLNARIINHDLAFSNNWYKQDLENAEKHLAHCLNAPESHGEFRISKYKYNQACLHFAKKEYEKAYRIYSQKMHFHTDKMGYAVWTRIMQVLCLIEMKDLLAASAKTKVLERQFERLKHLENFPPRTAIIIRVLISLEKADFRKEKLSKKSLALIHSLREKKKPHSWEHFTPELIRFHEWVGNL